jgi:transposase
MGIVGGLDIHRRQITFDHLDERSGETRHGRIARPTGCCRAAGCRSSTPTPAPAHRRRRGGGVHRLAVRGRGTAARRRRGASGRAGRHRGPKRRAKTDRTDARHLRELLAGGRLPESWIPPERVLSDARPAAAVPRPAREAHRLGAARPRHPAAPRRPGGHRRPARRRQLPPAGGRRGPVTGGAGGGGRRTVPSSPAEARVLPSAVKATAETPPVWPVSGASSGVVSRLFTSADRVSGLS